MEIMDESQGSPGERIVEWNLSYRLGDLPLWLCTHYSPLSNWYRNCAFLEGVSRAARAAARPGRTPAIDIMTAR